jgi:acetyl-CoA synthetase
MMIFTSAAHRIGRFDVESVVMEHQPVAEVAWSANPDPQRVEIVKASILLRPGTDGSDALTTEVQQHVRMRLALHAYPRQTECLADLPKN